MAKDYISKFLVLEVVMELLTSLLAVKHMAGDCGDVLTINSIDRAAKHLDMAVHELSKEIEEHRPYLASALNRFINSEGE